jgi:hypothetical protein
MKGKVFTAQEVQAIIAGNKTMFREVAKSKPLIKRGSDYLFDDNGKIVFQKDCCPYQVGQKIFCKETFEIWDDGLVYKADNSPANVVFKWKPAQHMKQEHSRLILLIKKIRVERLQEISEEDAFKEGIQRTDEWTGCADDLDFTDAFKFNWRATHKKLEEKFEANPWVWVCSFEVVK